MISGWRAFVFSFQTKLVLSITAAILLAIFFAGFVFVARQREERREQALERVAAASPAIYQQAFAALIEAQQVERPLAESLDELSNDQDVRIFILAPSGVILFDTDDRLTGSEIDVPRSTNIDIRRGFVAWEPEPGFPEGDLTLVAASSRFTFGRGQEIPFRIVLAVESDTIADAWRGILPGLGIAAAIAIPLAALAGIVLARQVANPVRRLTAATEALSRGDFDQRVEIARDDEIGRLARSFSTMAERVGQRDAQMRALLANVSHDLKSPMTSITGYAHSLTDGTTAPADAARVGAVIRDEAEHVNTLLADLLYLGEIDAGQVITRRETVDFEALVRRCVRRIEPATDAREIALTVDVEPDAVLREADPEKLERALTNLLENAAKFTPAGGTIAVSAAQQGMPPALVCDVSNSGSTIPEDDLPRIFDRFFRGDRARRTAGGSGLGLAIARELVELHGGQIAARNTPEGVAVTMTFPLR